METNGRIQCGWGSALSFSAVDGRPRCKCGALYAVTVTQLLDERGGQECTNCGDASVAGSGTIASTDEWRCKTALCEDCADKLGEGEGIDAPE